MLLVNFLTLQIKNSCPHTAYLKVLNNLQSLCSCEKQLVKVVFFKTQMQNVFKTVQRGPKQTFRGDDGTHTGDKEIYLRGLIQNFKGTNHKIKERRQHCKITDYIQ